MIISNRDAPQTLTVSHYREARRTLLDPLTFSSARPLTTSADGLGYCFVLFRQDPPEHSRLRALIQKEFISRRVTKPVLVDGTALCSGDTVLIDIGTANRDPVLFAEPEEFNPARREKGHLAFSHGIPYCVGVGLTRLEAEIMLNRILDRYASIALAAPGERYPNEYFRGFRSLLLTMELLQ